jgi:hypothetical protein
MTITQPPTTPTGSRPYKITFTTFEGKTRTMAWRAPAPYYVRGKAMQRTDCKALGPVAEISEDEFEQFRKIGAQQRRHPQGISNRGRRS